MILLQDRYLATLLGLHIGDAIWAPYETMNADAIAAALVRERGQVSFHRYRNPWPKDDNGSHLPAGRPTDDSDQAADLCYSLLQCDGVDTTHLRRSLQNSVIGGVSRLWHGQATGAGRTTRAMLGDDPEKYATIMGTPVASNGSLMRSAPMALWLGPTPKGYPTPNGVEYAMVKAMSEVTHTHPDSIAACWLYVRMLCNALADRDFRDVKAVNKFDRRVLEYLYEVEECAGLPADPGSFQKGWGAAEYSLKVALHAVILTDSFADCIQLVGRAGGDTGSRGISAAQVRYDITVNSADLTLAEETGALLVVNASGTIQDRPVETRLAVTCIDIVYRSGAFYCLPGDEPVVKHFSISSRGEGAENDMISTAIGALANLANRSEDDIETLAQELIGNIITSSAVPRILADVPVFELEDLGTSGTVARLTLQSFSVGDESVSITFSLLQLAIWAFVFIGLIVIVIALALYAPNAFLAFTFLGALGN